MKSTPLKNIPLMTTIFALVSLGLPSFAEAQTSATGTAVSSGAVPPKYDTAVTEKYLSADQKAQGDAGVDAFIASLQAKLDQYTVAAKTANDQTFINSTSREQNEIIRLKNWHNTIVNAAPGAAVDKAMIEEQERSVENQALYWSNVNDNYKPAACAAPTTTTSTGIEKITGLTKDLAAKTNNAVPVTDSPANSASAQDYMSCIKSMETSLYQGQKDFFNFTGKDGKKGPDTFGYHCSDQDLAIDGGKQQFSYVFMTNDGFKKLVFPKVDSDSFIDKQDVAAGDQQANEHYTYPVDMAPFTTSDGQTYYVGMNNQSFDLVTSNKFTSYVNLHKNPASNDDDGDSLVPFYMTPAQMKQKISDYRAARIKKGLSPISSLEDVPASSVSSAKSCVEQHVVTMMQSYALNFTTPAAQRNASEQNVFQSMQTAYPACKAIFNFSEFHNKFMRSTAK
jgi:hypothetical protein